MQMPVNCIREINAKRNLQIHFPVFKLTHAQRSSNCVRMSESQHEMNKFHVFTMKMVKPNAHKVNHTVLNRGALGCAVNATFVCNETMINNNT